MAANIGGEPPSVFGAIVRDAGGRELLASQHARVRDGRLRLTRSPRGPVSRGRPYPARPYAGTFRELEARGTIGAAGVRIATRYTFAPRHIDVRWRVRCAAGCAGRSVDVLLPTWGGRAAIDVVRRDGRRTRLAGAGRDRATLPLASADAIRLGRGRRGGYVVSRIARRPGAVLRTIDPRAQVTNTHPGPTLAIRLVDHRKFRNASLSLRIVPRGGA